MTADDFQKQCDAVEGYTALGLLVEASAILEDLPGDLKTTKHVIRLHLGILLNAQEYLKASYLAETLSLGDPDDVKGLVLVAECRYKAGEFRDALTWLASVEKKCLGAADFQYLIAQCHAALGDVEAAKESLKKAFVINEDLRLKAAEDPVFEKLW